MAIVRLLRRDEILTSLEADRRRSPPSPLPHSPQRRRPDGLIDNERLLWNTIHTLEFSGRIKEFQ